MAEMFNRLTFGRSLIIGFMVTAFYYFLIFDHGTSQVELIVGTQAQIEKAKADIKEVQAKLDRAQEFQNATRQLGQSIGRLLEFIPAGFRMGEFMKAVSTESRLAGLQVQRIAPMTVNEQDTPEFKELAVTLELKGQFNQVLKFMSSLTQKKQIFIYERLKMVQDIEPGNENGLIVTTAEIHAYEYIGVLPDATKTNAPAN